MESLFHIVSRDDWKIYFNGKEYAPPSLAKEGFIHLSTRAQALETAVVFFKNRNDLLLLELTISPSDSLLKYEGAVGDNRRGLFPHFYGKLSLSLVKCIFVMESKVDGSFDFPTKLIASP